MKRPRSRPPLLHISRATTKPLHPDTPLTSLTSGALARGAQTLLMYPIDTIKTRVQLSRTPHQTLTSAITTGSLYHGLPATLLGQIPYGMLVFGVYETTKSFLEGLGWERRVSVVVAAITGDVVGSVWLAPSEVVKGLVQGGYYGGVGECVRGVVGRGGGGLYKGYRGLLCRDVPFRVVQMGLYEEVRRVLKGVLGRELGNGENLGVGLGVSMVSAGITTPLDVLKTRLMTQGGGEVYKGVWDCVRVTVGGEGVRGLFRGVGPRVLLIGASGAVFFVVYEAVKGVLRKWEDERRVGVLGRGRSGKRADVVGRVVRSFGNVGRRRGFCARDVGFCQYSRRNVVVT